MKRPLSPHSRVAGLTRRRLLELGGLSAAGASLAPFGFAPAHAAGGGDYRALVCVFLYGGADTFNLVVPAEPEAYAAYAAARGDLAEPLESLLPITPASGGRDALGVHGQAPELRDLFDQQRLAFLANVGPLVKPVTKAEVTGSLAPLPTNLFSHIDQQREWQRAWAGSGVPQGWIGRMLDQLGDVNGDTPLPAAIAVSASDLILAGQTTSPYVIGTQGSIPLAGTQDPLRKAAIQALLAAESHPLGKPLASIQAEAIEIHDLLSELLGGAPTFEGQFPSSPLGQQLRMVAILISLREALGLSRQVFFVSAGGWDTHDIQQELLPGLFANLSASVGAFQSAVDSLGAANQVTTFSHTDFGRTLSSNGKGSDHGWGGNAFVVGGPVLGGDLYNALPDYQLGGPDDVGEGRVLPSVSVDQYAATLARWFGLAPALLPTVFPNLSNFPTDDLGFLA